MSGVLQDLLEKRDSAQTELDGILKLQDGSDRETSEVEETRAQELVNHIEGLDEDIERETANEKRARIVREARGVLRMNTADARVLDEPMVYGEGSPHSYYNDFARASWGVATDPTGTMGMVQRQRLIQWSHQLEREAALGTKNGKIAERQVVAASRESGVNPQDAVKDFRARGLASLEEKRAGVGSGGGATATASSGGAAFVSPVIMMGDYAPYREAGRAFTDQCNHQPLPDFGLDVYIPAVTGPAGVAAFSENPPGTSQLNETDPTFGYLSTALAPLAGQVTVSQILLDRAGPGFAFDRMIFDQLNRDYAPKLDALVLAAALSAAGTVTYTNAGGFSLTTASTNGGFVSKVAGAKAAIRTTAGTFLNPSHLFLVPGRWEMISAQADASARLQVLPDYAGPFQAVAAGSADGDEGVEGYTGYRLAGLRVFTDNNIPTPGTGADQAIIGDLSEVYVFEGNPVTRAVPQTLAGNLLVLLQLYNYWGVIVRYTKGVQVISGTGMATITF